MKNLILACALCFLGLSVSAQCSTFSVTTTVSDPTCYGFSDGCLTLLPTGGTPPYVVEVTDASGTIIFGPPCNLVEGWYYWTVTDDAGCVISDSVFIENPEVMSIDLDISHLLCNGDLSGMVIVDTVNNHQGSYSLISYNWSFSVGGLGVDSVSNLPAGSYSLDITDEFGCAQTIDFEITEPPALEFIEMGFEPAFCRLYAYQIGNGQVFAALSGGVPDYTYSWSHLESGVAYIGPTTGGLNPGEYIVTATDGNGCTLIDTVLLDSINPVADFVVNSTELDPIPAGYVGFAPATFSCTNTSSGFANIFNPLADTLFWWQLGNWAPWEETSDFYYEPETTLEYGGVWGIKLVAQNKNGCQDTAIQFIAIFGPAGIEDGGEQGGISFIPNSDEQLMTIRKFGMESGARIRFYSISGALLMDETVLDAEVSLPFHHPSGLYLFEIIDPQSGEKRDSGKISF